MDTQKNVILWSEVFDGEAEHPRSSECLLHRVEQGGGAIEIYMSKAVLVVVGGGGVLHTGKQGGRVSKHS